MIVGFGNCHGRLQVARFLRERGFLLATAVHPRATVAADVSIGAGSVIVAGSVINPAAAIGENVIINTGSSVDHECIIGGRGTHRAGGAFGGVCHRRARFVGRYRFGGKGRGAYRQRCDDWRRFGSAA
jgi:UDP-N-acetylbacillosamine N-acetyltransferase